MTKIHMDTDETRNLARTISRQVGNIDDLIDQLRRSKGRLSSAWHGGSRSARFLNSFSTLISTLDNKNHELDTLALRVNREIDQWLDVDSNFAARNRYPPGKFYKPGEKRKPTFEFFPKKEIDLKILEGSDTVNKWTPSDGWEEESGDPKIDVGVEIPIIGGNLGEGEVHAQNKEFGFLPVSSSASYELGEYEAGIKAGYDFTDQEASFGLFGEVTAAKASATRTVGTAMFGFTTGVAATAGNVEGFLGYKDGTAGASIGATAGSLEINQGLNIAGYNIGVSAGVSAGFEAGIKVGPEVKVKFGPFRAGLHFGKAIV